ncbi:MAG TPA: hypothetical protein VGM03_15875 [Phycisphaerae bacterium]
MASSREFVVTVAGGRYRCIGCLVLSIAAAAANGQSRPWVVFQDNQTDSACGVINTLDTPLILRSDDNVLVAVNGPDRALPALVVDENDCVLFNGQPAGFITFATDGDQRRSVWWLTSATGRVVQLDDFTGQPQATERAPADFHNVACDACAFWDTRSDCEIVSNGNGSATSPGLRLCGSGVGGAGMILVVTLGFAGAGSIGRWGLRVRTSHASGR